MKGYERRVDIWYQDGPVIKAGKGVETLAGTLKLLENAVNFVFRSEDQR
jgi:hypothetical protein